MLEITHMVFLGNGNRYAQSYSTILKVYHKHGLDVAAIMG